MQAGLRADAYRILAECYHSPDSEFLQALGGLAGAGAGAVDQIVQAAVGIDLEKLQIDHARLFLGPYKLLAAPYGSVYLEEGVLMGNSTMNVEEFYRQEGLEASDEEVPDHITAELEFMCVLIGKEIEAVEAGHRDIIGQYRQKQKAFLDLHLGTWIAEFTDKIQQSAQTEFYKTLGRITGQFVQEDHQLLMADDPENS
ncbi:MAG: molecular chaperone TorD family protein [bacterium]|nr:molecular chaperone TorD family protein [bacterium]